MPTANMGVPVKYMWVNHDDGLAWITPPVQNQWYTIMEDYDVRLLWITTEQWNGNAAAKDVEFRWTMDGFVYQRTINLAEHTVYYLYKNPDSIASGGWYIVETTNIVNAAYYIDKRAHHCKLEFRLTSVPGQNQDLMGQVIYEALEQVYP